MKTNLRVFILNDVGNRAYINQIKSSINEDRKENFKINKFLATALSLIKAWIFRIMNKGTNKEKNNKLNNKILIYILQQKQQN